MEYLRRKQATHDKIKAKTVNNKNKVITLHSQKGTKNTYWRMLKRLRGRNKYPLIISNANDSSCFIEDPKEIYRVLCEYWHIIILEQKIVTLNSQFTEKLKDKVNDLQNDIGVSNGLTDMTVDYEKKVESSIKVRMRL